MFARVPAWQRSLLYLIVMTGLMWHATSNMGRPTRASAQGTEEAGPSSGGETPADGSFAPPGETPPPKAAPSKAKSLNVWDLTLAGGIFMIPLFGMSIVAATMSVERFIGLRKMKIIPDELVRELGQLGGVQGGFDPRKAYKICQQYPSTAAKVVRAMLLKVGRPLSEVESTVKETSEREATRLYTNVRWLNLISSMATMVGLLGTVQGMILAFHELTNISPGEDKTVKLASGIYTALITTFAGLCIAIPAGGLAHYFEGRIVAMFNDVQELVNSLLPQVERYEGRVRFSRQGDDVGAEAATPVGSGAGNS